MHKDPTQFRERFKRWKEGEQVYENGIALPAYEDGKDADLTPLDLAIMHANNKVYGEDKYIDTAMLRRIDNYMISKKVTLPLRLAIIYTIQLEGNTTGDHKNGAIGLVGWRGSRAVGLSKTVEGLSAKLYKEVYGDFNPDNWNHGGKGSGYNSAKEAQEAFKAAKTVQDATKALNYGYVRPPLEDRINRTKNSSMVFKKHDNGKNLTDSEYTPLLELEILNYFDSGKDVLKLLNLWSNVPQIGDIMGRKLYFKLPALNIYKS